jgi:CBS domain-containing protein
MIIDSILGSKGRDVATVSKDHSLLDAAALLRDHGVGALVVSADGRHIDGIVSERDLVRAIAAHGSGGLGRDIASVMTHEVITCTAADAIDEVMSVMTERRVRHMPVIDGDGLLAGIVSIGDIVKVRVNLLERENQTLNDYIHAR